MVAAHFAPGSSEGEPEALIPLTVNIVGVGRLAREVVPTTKLDSEEQLLMTPATYREYAEGHQLNFDGTAVRLRDGADMAAFRAAAERLASERAEEVGGDILFADNRDRDRRVERAIRPQAVALVVFAAFAGLAGLLVLGQALSRQLSEDATEVPVLRTLGLTRASWSGWRWAAPRSSPVPPPRSRSRWRSRCRRCSRSERLAGPSCTRAWRSTWPSSAPARSPSSSSSSSAPPCPPGGWRPCPPACRARRHRPGPQPIVRGAGAAVGCPLTQCGGRCAHGPGAGTRAPRSARAHDAGRGGDRPGRGGHHRHLRRQPRPTGHHAPPVRAELGRHRRRQLRRHRPRPRQRRSSGAPRMCRAGRAATTARRPSGAGRRPRRGWTAM